MAKNNYITKRHLPCKLTDEELLGISRELAKDSQDIQDIENKKKEVNADFTAQMNRMKSAIEIASRKISTGEEYRDVECSVVLDVTAMKKTLIRVDIAKVIKEEKLTTEDLQQELEFAKKQEGDK